MAPRKIFISYAREDKEFLDGLVEHFSPYTQADNVRLWFDDASLEPGACWKDKITGAIRDADVFVMLVTKNYIDSDYCFDKEAVFARQLQDLGELKIVPLYVSPVAIERLWISDLPVLPSLSTPVSNAINKDGLLKEICSKLAHPREDQTSAVADVLFRPRRGDVDAVMRQEFARPSLASAFDRYDETLQTLFTELSSLEYKPVTREEDILQVFLNAISNASAANAILHYRGRAEIGSAGDNNHQEALSELFECARIESAWVFDRELGSRLNVESCGQGKALSLLPLSRDKNDGIAVLHDDGAACNVDEVLLFTLKMIYQLSSGFTERCSVTDLEKNVYDLLKKRYQHVSKRMYAERLSIFRSELHSIHMQFEPIYSFDNVHHSFMIYGWEALARVGDSKSAPVDILRAAEIWGTEFKAALDVYVLEQSIATYQKKTQETNGSRVEDIRPLSINIYPDSLFQNHYHQMLDKLVRQDRLINGRNLILEVSEKSIIDETDEKGNGETVQAFVDHMETLRANYKIRFAIDDFGAGHSSIIRLNRLKPEWVKIDREILHCEPKFAKALIRNLLTIKSDWGRPAFKVIIEGLDSYSNIELGELVNDLGVEYIQGHLLGMSQQDIIPCPSKEHGDRLKAYAGW